MTPASPLSRPFGRRKGCSKCARLVSKHEPRSLGDKPTSLDMAPTPAHWSNLVAFGFGQGRFERGEENQHLAPELWRGCVASRRVSTLRQRLTTLPSPEKMPPCWPNGLGPVGETAMARRVVEFDGLLKMLVSVGKVAEIKVVGAGDAVRDQGL